LVDIQKSPVSHPDGGFVFGGTRFAAPDGDMNQWAKERPVQTAIVLMAGISAEEVILECHLRESWLGDLRILRIGHGWLEGMSDLPREMFRYLNEAHEAVTRNETAIRRVADALLSSGRLNVDEIADLVDVPFAGDERNRMTERGLVQQQRRDRRDVRDEVEHAEDSCSFLIQTHAASLSPRSQADFYVPRTL